MVDNLNVMFLDYNSKALLRQIEIDYTEFSVLITVGTISLSYETSIIEYNIFRYYTIIDINNERLYIIELLPLISLNLKEFNEGVVKNDVHSMCLNSTFCKVLSKPYVTQWEKKL